MSISPLDLIALSTQNLERLTHSPPPTPADDPTPVLPEYIDATMFSAFRKCPQKFFNEFLRGLRTTRGGISIDLHAGGMFAAYIEWISKEVHAGRSLLSALEFGEFRFMKEWGDVITPASNPKTADRVWAAILSYFIHWPPLSDPIQPLFVEGLPTYEFKFAIPLDLETTGLDFPLHPVTHQPFIFCGRADLLGIHKPTGRKLLRDEKTSKLSPPHNWADQWSNRRQFMGYVWAAQQLGLEDLDTVCVRGITIQKTQIKLIDHYPRYLPFQITRWLNQAHTDLTRLVATWNRYSEENIPFDFDMADACTSYGGCPYLDICTAPRLDMYLSQYSVRRWNPLTHGMTPVEDD